MKCQKTQRSGRIRFLILLGPTVLSMSWSSGTSSAETASQAFQDLAARYVDESPGLSPVSATSLGDHRFDRQLDDVSPAARDRARDFFTEFTSALEQIDPIQLKRSDRVDLHLLRHEVRRRLWHLDQLQEWAWNPLRYTQLAGGAIYGLLARDFAPIEERTESVIARLEQFPRLYEQVRATLEPDRVPKVHAETAIKQNRGVLSILKNMLQPRLAELSAEQQKRVASAIERATAAIQKHQDWLESELLPRAGGDFRLGKELYDSKLALTLQTSFSRQEIHDRAASELSRVRAQMYEVSRGIVAEDTPASELPNAPTRKQQQAAIEAALELAYADKPGKDEVVSAARRSLTIATAFIRERDLVTIPEDPLDIILMPEFQRGVSFAYCDSPGPLEVGQKTFYAVAPLPKDWTEEQADSFLREYNVRSVHNLTIHEAMPGHFLQLAHANRYPGKLRALLSSGVFIEGWANYTELMMSEEGFLDKDPLMRLIMLKWYLRSIANALIDQSIHVDGLQREAAMRLMVEDTFQEEREAAAKWVRAQLTSTQLSTYFVGFQEHREMRAAAEAAWAANFTLKRYHDQVLSFGSPPVRYVRALMLGEPIPE